MLRNKHASSTVQVTEILDDTYNIGNIGLNDKQKIIDMLLVNCLSYTHKTAACRKAECATCKQKLQ